MKTKLIASNLVFVNVEKRSGLNIILQSGSFRLSRLWREVNNKPMFKETKLEETKSIGNVLFF